MNFQNQQLLRVIVFCLLLSFITSCRQKEDYFTGGDVRTWLLLDTSASAYNHYKPGFIVMKNGYGIFISSTSGEEIMRQPGMYDASASKLSHCIFKWKIEDKTLMFDYSFKIKDKILLLTNDTLKLEIKNKIVTYIRETQI